MDITADERRRQIWHLYAAEGWKPRKIAREYGLSRSQTYRIIAMGPPEPPDDDGLEEELAAFAAVMADTSPYARAPFTFTGMEPTEQVVPGVDSGKPVLVEWFTDADGNEVTMQDIYRADFQDGSVDRGYLDDALAQIRAAGYRESDAVDGRWHWVGPSSV